MKANRLICTILALLAIQVCAEQHDRQKMLEEIKTRAEEGEAQAQIELGRHFLEQGDVTHDDAEALKWFHRAADQGLPEAQYELGLCYTIAVNKQLNQEEAAKWFRKAAEESHSKTQYMLGLSCFHGDGVP